MCDCRVERYPSGLRKAIDIITEPLKPIVPTNDIVLKDLVSRWEKNTFKLNSMRTRIGLAWEHVFTDFGFRRYPYDIDLINSRRKIAIALKNGWDVNNNVKRYDHNQLLMFKQDNPGYEVIFGHVNYKDAIGKDVRVEGVRYMYGAMFLQYIMHGRQSKLIAHLREAVHTARLSYLANDL